MSLKRVQKLLFSEYCDFEDMVLIESPFAQTTREGKGIRQVHIGLTSSKLVLATDVLPPVEKSFIGFIPGIDPDIETFELIAIYPIECINLSIFRRHKRQTLKAHFCNNRIFYFELGGFERRNMFWNLWCEKVKFLSPEYSGSSHSETSVATSSTGSTLYLVDSKQVVKPNGLKQLWCKFGTGKHPSGVVRKWTDRYLYLGKNFDDPPTFYHPSVVKPQVSQFVKHKPVVNFCVSSTKTNDSLAKEIHIGDSYSINRFGLGIKEGCSTGLFLPAEDYIVPRRFSYLTDPSSGLYDENNLKMPFNIDDHLLVDYMEMAETSVKLWELKTETHRYESRRHRRRYGFVPQPLFLHGLGPWNVTSGAKYSIQVKRAVSVVSIRRQPMEPELRLPVPKRQLVATISCDKLTSCGEEGKINKCSCPRRPVIFFWTPDYWYRPRSARDAYLELHSHLGKIRDFQYKNKKRRLFRRRRAKNYSSESESDDQDLRKSKKQPKKRLSFAVFGSKSPGMMCDSGRRKKSKETSLQYLKRLVKENVVLTAWDFNSTTLAQQLTIIDRDLFLKISAKELSVLVWQQSSKNAPNVAASVAFSHRISCLVASDILKNECERTRARLIARFINVAYKCHIISNFQSCRTILFGLQSPAIFRMKTTWAYVRKKHASKYQTFEFLSRLYRDPRLFSYQKAFFFSSQDTPYLPFIGDIIAKLLDRIPEYKIKVPLKSPATREKQLKPCGKSEDASNLFTKMLISMKLINFTDKNLSNQPGSGDCEVKGLCDYFKPLDCYEDNRAKCLSETTEFLQQCQLSALHYNFNINALASDYLLKARYKEERENFFQSFKVEAKNPGSNSGGQIVRGT